MHQAGRCCRSGRVCEKTESSLAAMNSKTMFLVSTLLVMTLVAQLVSLYFGRIDSSQDFSAIILPSLFVLTVVTLPACVVGAMLGRNLGNGFSQLHLLMSGEPGIHFQPQKDDFRPLLLGFSLGAVLLLLRYATQSYLPSEIPALGYRGAVGGLAVSFGAAIGEEVWFRFGLMTLLVWIATRVTRHSEPTNTIVWGVIFVAAICFAIAHVPQLIAYGAGNVVGVSATLLGNIAVGLLYGWLYWQRGLIAAIVAHFAVDLILHVLSALI